MFRTAAVRASLLVLVLLCLAVRAARAEDVVVVAERATVRAGPGLSHKELRVARRGERLAVASLEGAWLRIKGKPEAWIAASNVRAAGPSAEGAGTPRVEDEDAFFDWVGERGDVAELTVREPGHVWVVFAREVYGAPQRLREAARDIACGYRRVAGFKGAATATVWPESGPGDRFVARETCRP